LKLRVFSRKTSNVNNVYKKITPHCADIHPNVGPIF
jgi:hypothetical protein